MSLLKYYDITLFDQTGPIHERLEIICQNGPEKDKMNSVCESHTSLVDWTNLQKVCDSIRDVVCRLRLLTLNWLATAFSVIAVIG